CIGPGRNSNGFFITSRNTPFSPKYDDNPKVSGTSCRKREISRLAPASASGLGLTNVRPQTKFGVLPGSPVVTERISQPIVPAAILLVLSIATSNASFAHAQTSPPAHPFFLTLGAGKKSVVGYTPSQIQHGYGFDQITAQGKGQTIAIV